ncbi:Cytochrome c oxidase assembly protein cox11, mitochondrial [Malassezia vespertilionis]|uniref:Cytochrome c oxidase assembly protein cox11, mitochondrial n=1 Tax=Malassezia vespertilionis TaxID=2020962 RepID=UPI0024B24C6B|nr:Cytochrome c oxidase assembly protein cox11, mitochondrial [Malassezia vespertilionis]WFD07988.1 Cytochrome c oxidase assembly protein cox11, mitochondrial [Malassezia vespertilionis]
MTDRERYSDASRLHPTYSDPFNETKDTERIRISFSATHSDQIPWSFVPEQPEIYVLPGETALTFFKAHNYSDKDIIGIATYNVVPDRVRVVAVLSPQIAPYFAKIECFCFEEQKLLAGEVIDLPVFFFLDKDMLEDGETRDVKDVILNYTFFSARRNPVNGQLEYVYRQS